MIYFFHHYELPVILQQAQIQDILMRNQEGGGPPLRFTQQRTVTTAHGKFSRNFSVTILFERQRTLVRVPPEYLPKPKT